MKILVHIVSTKNNINKTGTNTKIIGKTSKITIQQKREKKSVRILEKRRKKEKLHFLVFAFFPVKHTRQIYVQIDMYTDLYFLDLILNKKQNNQNNKGLIGEIEIKNILKLYKASATLID